MARIAHLIGFLALTLLSACGAEPQDDRTPPFEGPTWGAACRAFPPASKIIALDDVGERLFAGPAGYFLEDADSVLPSVSFDGGDTWTPVIAPFNPHTRRRIFTRTHGVWAFGEALFVGVDAPNALESVSTEVDWMLVSVDGGRTFSRELASFERIPIDDRVEANRLWQAGDARLASTGSDYYRSVDGGATWRPAILREGSPNDAYRVRDTSIGGDPSLILDGDAGFSVRLAFDPELSPEGIDAAVALENEILFVLRAASSLRSRSRLLCRAAAGREPALRGLPSPKALASIEPGEIALHARVSYAHRGDLDLIPHLAVSTSDKIYVSTGRTIAVGGALHRVISTAATETGEFFGVDALDTVLWPGELSVTGIVREITRSNDGARYLRTWDSRSGLPFVLDQFVGLRELGTTGPTPFGRATTTADATLVVRGGSTRHFGARRSGDPPNVQGSLFIGKAFLAGRAMIQAFTTGIEREDTHLLVSDVVDAPEIPDPRVCLDAAPPAACFRLEDASIVRASVDREGRVYALDRERRALLRQSLDDPSTFEAVVEGLQSPSDFEIVERDGRAHALLLDLDVYAVDLESESPLRRRHP